MLGFILHFLKIMPISDGMYYAVPLAPLAMLGIGAGVQALTGIGQMLFAPKKKEPPKFKVSPFEEQALGLSQQMAATGMPEAQRTAALQNIQQSAVQAGRAALMGGRGSLLGSIGNVQAQQDRSLLGLAAQDATIRQQNLRNYETALLRRAQTDYRAFQNEAQQYANEEMRRASIVGAGAANLGRAASMFGQGAMMSLYGGGSTTTNTTTNPLLTQQSYSPQQQFLSGNINPISYTPRLPRFRP